MVRSVKEFSTVSFKSGSGELGELTLTSSSISTMHIQNKKRKNEKCKNMWWDYMSKKIEKNEKTSYHITILLPGIFRLFG